MTPDEIAKLDRDRDPAYLRKQRIGLRLTPQLRTYLLQRASDRNTTLSAEARALMLRGLHADTDFRRIEAGE